MAQASARPASARSGIGRSIASWGILFRVHMRVQAMFGDMEIFARALHRARVLVLLMGMTLVRCDLAAPWVLGLVRRMRGFFGHGLVNGLAAELRGLGRVGLGDDVRILHQDDRPRRFPGAGD